MDRWDEMRTAYWVAKLGTISKAADHLGIHRATVTRHIDTLEEALGGKLFQRHARGVEPTDAGRDLVQVARAASEQFEQLAGRTRGRSHRVSGELVVTTIELISPLLLAPLRRFRSENSDCTVRVDVSGRLYKLEYGEAHVAVRAGSRPRDPDNVVEALFTMRSALYAHPSYIQRHASASSGVDLTPHQYISDGPADGHTTLSKWLAQTEPHGSVTFSSTNTVLRSAAIQAGLGVGFLPIQLADMHSDLVQVAPPQPQWDIPVWLVTHVDLHRSGKVQAALKALRSLRDSEPRVEATSSTSW